MVVAALPMALCIIHSQGAAFCLSKIVTNAQKALNGTIPNGLCLENVGNTRFAPPDIDGIWGQRKRKGLSATSRWGKLLGAVIASQTPKLFARWKTSDMSDIAFLLYCGAISGSCLHLGGCGKQSQNPRPPSQICIHLRLLLIIRIPPRTTKAPAPKAQSRPPSWGRR